MINVNRLFAKYKEIIIYIVFGVLTTLLNFAVFFCLQSVFGKDGYLLHNAIAWVAGVLFAYVTNKLFVFNSKSWSVKVVVKESMQFTVARLISFFVEELGLLLLVDVLNVGNYTLNLRVITINGAGVSKIFLAVVVVILNYIFSKFIIFKKEQ